MNTRQKRIADRLQQLANEGRQIAEAAENEINQYAPDKAQLHAFLVKTRNVIEGTFHRSAHYRHLDDLISQDVSRAHQINRVVGVLEGARDDLISGFLVGQEMLVAGEIFDDVLQEAKHLHKSGYENPAAVLGRVVLEQTLRRIADREGICDTPKASKLNDELKTTGLYSQLQWRQVQAWLDIGNAAAHGDFDDYTEEQVAQMLEGVEQFAGVYLSP